MYKKFTAQRYCGRAVAVAYSMYNRGLSSPARCRKNRQKFFLLISNKCLTNGFAGAIIHSNKCLQVCGCYFGFMPHCPRRHLQAGYTYAQCRYFANFNRKRQVRCVVLLFGFKTGEHEGRARKCFRRGNMPLLYSRREMYLPP